MTLPSVDLVCAVSMFMLGMAVAMKFIESLP
jgi:hypothetical protein